MVSMNRSLVFLMICLMTTAFLAGCHEPTPADPADGDDGTGDDTDGDDGGDNMTATFDVQDEPTVVTAGDTINLTVTVTLPDGQTITSTHSGFHFGYESSEGKDPSEYTSVLTERSPHVTTEMTYPGEYTVQNWTIPEDKGGETLYYRPHVQANGMDHWGDEHTFLINPIS